MAGGIEDIVFVGTRKGISVTGPALGRSLCIQLMPGLPVHDHVAAQLRTNKLPVLAAHSWRNW